MSMSHGGIVVACVLALAGVVAVQAARAEEPAAPRADPMRAGQEVFENRVEAADLSRVRGGVNDVAINLADALSNISDNTASNVQTGRIEGIDVDDVSGLSTLNFNTGLNANFQTIYQLNIYLK